MVKTYKILFDRYHREVCRHAKEGNKMTCTVMCEEWGTQLKGMLNLLLESHDISCDEWSMEQDRIKDTFDSMKICGAYLLRGNICKY